MLPLILRSGRRIIGIGTLILTYQFVIAQKDSSLVQMQILGTEDIAINEDIITRQKVVGASRSSRDLGDLPFTIHVVTKDDIFQNGYTTLVDVMKSVPGVRVSQPGSALEGETFMMRGLLGNAYTKILINNMPIKPSVVNGMPIGAQLPIKEAERIEVIFGPAAAIYGADAAAGVINIIMKESERPIYAQADLSLGTNSLTNLNLLLGGKVGKDKNVLKFNIYGSHTQMDDRRIVYDRENLYNPSLYSVRGDITGVLDTSYTSNQNYRGTAFNPQINELPHLSSSFGMSLNFRSFSLSFDRLTRLDHSAIGLSPLAAGYYNPLAFTGEEILKVHAAFSKSTGKLQFTTNVNFLSYEMDNRSAKIHVRNTFGQLSHFISDLQFPDDKVSRDIFVNTVNSIYFSRLRFDYANSQDFRLEQLLTYIPSEHAEIFMGVAANFAAALPIVNYLPIPFNGDIEFEDDWEYSGQAPIAPGTSTEGDVSGFAQLYLSYDNWNAIVGGQYFSHSKYGNAFSPRIAALYKISETASLRMSYGSAFRAPSPFYNASTLDVDIFDFSTVTTSTQPLEAEKTTSYELGARWLEKKVKADLSIFYSKTKNFISFNFNDQLDATSSILSIGYFNDDKSSATVFGIQSSLEIKDIFPKNEVGVKLSLNYNNGSEVLPFDSGELDGVKGLPEFIGQLNISMKVKDKFYLSFMNIAMSESLNRRLVDSETLNDTSIRDRFINKGYYTLDILARMPLTDNFQGYIKILNVFNAEYAGIGASGTVDDLAYNPQSLGTFQLGLSYRMH